MDKDIIVFGTGTLAVKFSELLPTDRILCFLDNDPEKQKQTFKGRNILPPENLKALDYRIIVIFVSKGYMQIYRQLTEELNIDPHRIMFWGHYLNMTDPGDAFRRIYKTVTDGTYENVVDYDTYMVENDPFIRQKGAISAFYGCYKNAALNRKIMVNLYDSVFESLEEFGGVSPDIIVLGRIYEKLRPEELGPLLNRCLQRAASVCYTVPYPDMLTGDEWNNILCGQGGRTLVEDGVFERIVFIEKQRTASVSIYIAAHKPFTPPDNPVYRPLWLGNPEENHWNYQNDRQGKNISQWNPLINECTGLYWIWKNADCDIAGMVHYRRYFLKNDLCQNRNNLLDKETVHRILQHYDMIVNQVKYLPDTMAGHLAKSIQPEAFQSGWELIYNALAKHQPDWLDLFQKVMEGHYAFFCNMFITRKEILDDYCEWLFSILPDAVGQADVSGFEPFSKRVIGFFAERLFTVWLCGQKLLLKQLPMLFER